MVAVLGHVDAVYRATYYCTAGEGVGPLCLNCGAGPDAHGDDALCRFEGEFGDVTVLADVVAVAADGSQLDSWRRRPGAYWPCSVLARFTSLVAWFDGNGLVELQGYDVDNVPDVYDTDDVPGDELSAWSADVLRDVLPGEHPAWFVAVGQFDTDSVAS